MIITKIEPHQRPSKRYNIYIDGKFLLSLHKDVILQNDLKIGDRITKKKIDSLVEKEEVYKAKDKALRLLAVRPRSKQELRQKLLEKKFNPKHIESVISYLVEKGYIDDKTFAQYITESIISRKPASRVFLKQVLKKKGINTEIINSTITKLLPEEYRLALEAGKKYLKRLQKSSKSIDNKIQQKRLCSYLLHRGFNWSTIVSTVRELFKQNENSNFHIDISVE